MRLHAQLALYQRCQPLPVYNQIRPLDKGNIRRLGSSAAPHHRVIPVLSPTLNLYSGFRSLAYQKQASYPAAQTVDYHRSAFYATDKNLILLTHAVHKIH